ncbi:hypothetical protein B0H12DRAFT_1082594 [Mycena haematopus]|nr:hypothetical protein B0H12DRAFT_1082594 [Mycena haematopus]
MPHSVIIFEMIHDQGHFIFTFQQQIDLSLLILKALSYKYDDPNINRHNPVANLFGKQNYPGVLFSRENFNNWGQVTFPESQIDSTLVTSFEQMVKRDYDLPLSDAHTLLNSRRSGKTGKKKCFQARDDEDQALEFDNCTCLNAWKASGGQASGGMSELGKFHIPAGLDSYATAVACPKCDASCTAVWPFPDDHDTIADVICMAEGGRTATIA